MPRGAVAWTGFFAITPVGLLHLAMILSTNGFTISGSPLGVKADAASAHSSLGPGARRSCRAGGGRAGGRLLSRQADPVDHRLWRRRRLRCLCAHAGAA